MLEFQILDVDYTIVNEKPVLRIFGKDKSKKTVCCFFENFEPYFYVEGKDAGTILKDKENVMRVKKIKKNTIDGEREVCKIVTQNPARTPELREYAHSKGLISYEADIPFKYRFMNDFGIDGMGWVKVKGDSVSTSVVSADIKIKGKEIVPLKRDEDADLRYMAFDIECLSQRGIEMPEAKKDPIILISTVFSESHKGRKSYVLGIKPGSGVTSFQTEKEMLEEFIKIVKDYDPDIITGYNVNGFDIPYILERMKQNNINPVFGRCKQKQVTSRRIGILQKTNISGRIVVDSFEIVKKDFSLQRYGLDYVAKKLLNQRKDPIRVAEMYKFWNSKKEDDFNRFIEYSRKDSILALNLVISLKLLDKYIGLSKISGILLQDTLDSGETTRIENYILREFNKAGYIFPCKPNQKTISQRDKIRREALIGGEVLEPIKGLHSNVVVFDFKSMYPSIVKTFNICPTTLSREENDDCVTLASGSCFLKKEVKEGIIPKIIENMMDKRGEVKGKLKRARDPEKQRRLYAKQWALKIMANAFYGYFGYTRAKIFNLDIANAITATGRATILDTKKKIEDKYKYKVVYGDTDSVFVKIDEDLEKMVSISEGIAKYITKDLPGAIELEFEKILKRFLPLTKKRYAAWVMTKIDGEWKEGLETKGIETVRRDWCGLVGKVIKNVLETLLKENDEKAAVGYFKGIIKDLMKNNVPIEELVMTKTMTKKPESYAGMQAHIELVKKIRARNPAECPNIGDRVGFVIVKGTQLLCKRAEDPNYVREKGLPIDSSYYIENQLLPPLERVFKGLGISKSELLGNGKQIGLMDIFKNSVKESQISEVPINEVTGFVCEKCSKFYERPPLIGTCECGGNIRFNSPKGTVKVAVL